jgi:predicted enzyme related to lactoylglutathione lyase
MAGELSFFELGVEDVEQAHAFYGALFGWRMDRPPGSEGWTIHSHGVPGGMHGGDAKASPYVFFAVDDMDAACARVVALGGTVLDMDLDGDEQQQERFGRFRLCTDDQGSSFGLHELPG